MTFRSLPRELDIIICSRIRRRFWSKVQILDPNNPPGVWLWTGAAKDDGYGVFWVDDERGTQLAHRVAWVMRRGPIPAGTTIQHRHIPEGRDSPIILDVNPDHMELLPFGENVAEGNRRNSENGRHRGAVAKVHTYGMSNEDQVSCKRCSGLTVGEIRGTMLTYRCLSCNETMSEREGNAYRLGA